MKTVSITIHSMNCIYLHNLFARTVAQKMSVVFIRYALVADISLSVVHPMVLSRN